MRSFPPLPLIFHLIFRLASPGPRAAEFGFNYEF
jgi:hypothetical protein